jgi:Pyruvate/2-oxoacid:ferredoxin oxidoreductase delta subunit
MSPWLLILLAPVIIIAMLWIMLERSLKPGKSTRAFWSLSPLPFFKKLEGYIYGSRPHWYLKPATWSWFMKPGRPESADSYHGKVLTGTDAVKLVSLNQAVELRNLEHVVPYPLARDIIMEQPRSLVAMRCPCREQKKDGCQPREVCLVVGEPFASFAVEHQPGRARFIDLDEALDILKSEEERGHIHTAWFKDAMHNRFYCICNCCSCCCLGMKSFERGAPRLTHSGYLPRLDEEECSACGVCSTVCPFSAAVRDEERPYFDLEKCMGCGLCVSHCPATALTLELAPHKGIPLSIDRLVQEETNGLDRLSKGKGIPR